MQESKTTIFTRVQAQRIARRMSDLEASVFADHDKFWKLKETEAILSTDKVLAAMVNLGYKFVHPRDAQ